MDVDSIPWPGGDWQATARLFGALIGGYLLVLWFASILWVYRDIQARSQDPITQAIGVGISVVLPLVGLPVYMVVRPQDTLQDAYDRQLEQEAILSELHSVTGCPNCRRPVQDDFQFCAFCGTSLKSACASCGRLLQFSWRVCPSCQTPKPRPQPDPAEVARQREAEAAASRRPSANAAQAQRAAASNAAARPARTQNSSASSNTGGGGSTGAPARGRRDNGTAADETPAQTPAQTPAPRPRRPRQATGTDE